MKIKYERSAQIGRILCGLVSFIFLMSFFLLTYLGRARLCCADMYSDELFARAMWESKSFFPDNWAFGNQYNIISTPVIMSFFYGLTGSLNAALVCACVLENLFIILAFLWAFHPFCSRNELSIGLMILLGGIITSHPEIRYVGQHLYIMANYYSCYVIVFLLVCGDWARIISGYRTKILSFSFILCIVLSFGVGMQSIRQFLVMGIPIFLVEILRIIFLIIQQKHTLSKEQWRPFIAATSYCCATLLGFLFCKLVHPDHTTIYGSTSLLPITQWINQIPGIFKNISEITGLTALRHGHTTPNILAIILWPISIGIVIAAIVMLIRCWIKAKTLYSNIPELIVFLGSISFLGILAVDLITDMNVSGRYYFIWHPLVAFSVLSIWNHLKTGYRFHVTCFLCILLIGNLFYSYVPSIKTALEPQNSKEDIAEWIVDNNYDYLYGNWNYTNSIAPYADGKIIPGPWANNVFEILDYIALTDVFTEECNQNAVYLIMQDEYPKAEKIATDMNVELKLQASFDNGKYALYTSPKLLMKDSQNYPE